ncbi:type VI secretion system tip protein VgrG [Pantoea sp. Tr-811]|uniref:type VI secretion system Vgr family protein n=1 Tax=Pantoea sp. Tr-811 TaxID=2608361 RepID=UPI001423D815|nr:type VI secretion system tip protein TssI/VgrG [Pantoea sp. Tr-811]NIF26632.1 type VI secretion system tip protein VgrG [Pantoea sp. Tr-811]
MPKQSDLRFSFQPLAADVTLEVVSFVLDEALSTPFQLHLELIGYEDDINFGHLLDKPALFTIWNGQRPVRYVHGLVSSFRQGDSGFHRTRYHALVEPQLARAELRSNWRIFQHKTVPQILELMFQRQGILRLQMNAFAEHKEREFCVQADETDLAFIARLAAEEGFVYRFAHSAKEHTLIITDRLQSLGMISRGALNADDTDDGFYEDDDAVGPDQVLYHVNSGGDPAIPCLRRFHYSEQVRTACQVHHDYTFTHPAYRLNQRAAAYGVVHQSMNYERFDYPGRYKRSAVGIPFTETRLSGLRHDACIANVEGDDMRLQPGLAFTLKGHSRQDLNALWRVISVHHEGSQFTSLQEDAADAKQGTHYTQTAVLVPGKMEWRPAPLPRPRVDGPHMATVVGPPGEEIYCDEWGRVKVSFPWDRESRNNEFSSCWVRVSQAWAGGSWGAMAIPRIGQDVIIHYVNGDPDQPMITGRTYCGNQLPPYDLPEHKTRMTIKSQTHKGEGFNELRFEDELGRQEVFIHAERDQNNVVKHDETTQVGNDRSEQVGHSETISIGHDRTESVGNDERVQIGQDALLDVVRNQITTIGKDHRLEVGNHRFDRTAANHTLEVGGHREEAVQGHVHLTAGQEIQQHARRFTLQVQDEIVLEGAGGTLMIDANGITLKGVALHIQAPLDMQATGAGNSHVASGVPAQGSGLDQVCEMRSDGRCTRSPCPCAKERT